MNRRVSERMERIARLFPDLEALAGRKMQPSADALATFRRYGLSREARLVATDSARRCEATAGACYAAIARSLIPR